MTEYLVILKSDKGEILTEKLLPMEPTKELMTDFLEKLEDGQDFHVQYWRVS